MARFALAGLTLVLTIGSAACREEATSAVVPSSATDPDAAVTSDAAADAAATSRYDFRPDRYSRACTKDDDCVLVTAIRQCGICGCGTAVRRGDADRDEAAVLAACREPDAPPSSRCELECSDARAACFEQVCVMLPPDGGP